MKKYLKIFLVILLFISSINIAYVGSPSDLINIDEVEVPYCQEEGTCGLEEGINQVEPIDVSLKDKKFSEYSQDLVVYVLGFVYLIAIILIIYAGFNILTGAGDEEKVKKSKKIILFVVLGMVIIFLANPILEFVEKVLNIGGN